MVGDTIIYHYVKNRVEFLCCRGCRPEKPLFLHMWLHHSTSGPKAYMIAAQIAHTLGNGEESMTSCVARNPFLHDDVPRSDCCGSAHLSLSRPCNDHPWYDHRDAPGDHRGGSYQSRTAKGNKNMFSVVSIKTHIKQVHTNGLTTEVLAV
jgi:hypothetical protein